MRRRIEAVLVIALLIAGSLPASAHIHQARCADKTQQPMHHHHAGMQMVEGQCCQAATVSGTCCEREMPVPEGTCASSGACCVVENKPATSPGKDPRALDLGSDVATPMGVPVRAAPSPPLAASIGVPFARPVFELKSDLRI
jgi:hypothetical protein